MANESTSQQSHLTNVLAFTSDSAFAAKWWIWLINIKSDYVHLPATIQPRQLNCHINLIFLSRPFCRPFYAILALIQDCPKPDADFRAQQCSEFNNQSFRGQTYNWEPYIKGNEVSSFFSHQPTMLIELSKILFRRRRMRSELPTREPKVLCEAQGICGRWNSLLEDSQSAQEQHHCRAGCLRRRQMQGERIKKLLHNSSPLFLIKTRVPKSDGATSDT